ncbi:MAG: hypothetical protein FWC03_10620 [Treponema sp.]|nr:hypothetical protein [Treponema sp.]
MAWVFGGKKFGQYTYEHWFDDDEYDGIKQENREQEERGDSEKSNSGPIEESFNENTIPHKP